MSIETHEDEVNPTDVIKEEGEANADTPIEKWAEDAEDAAKTEIINKSSQFDMPPLTKDNIIRQDESWILIRFWNKSSILNFSQDGTLAVVRSTEADGTKRETRYNTKWQHTTDPSKKGSWTTER